MDYNFDNLLNDSEEIKDSNNTNEEKYNSDNSLPKTKTDNMIETIKEKCNDFKKDYKIQQEKIKNKSDNLLNEFEKMMEKHLKIIDGVQNVIITEQAYNHLLLKSYTSLIETSSRSSESIFNIMDKKKVILEEEIFEEEIEDPQNNTGGNTFIFNGSFIDDVIENKLDKSMEIEVKEHDDKPKKKQKKKRVK